MSRLSDPGKYDSEPATLPSLSEKNGFDPDFSPEKSRLSDQSREWLDDLRFLLLTLGAVSAIVTVAGAAFLYFWG